MIQHKWYRRRALYAALVVGLLVAAIPVSQSLASATSGTTVPIEKTTALGSCDFTGTHKVIGEATITHNKDGSVSVKYSLHGADPTRNYFLFLVSDSPLACNLVGVGGKFKVDAGGDGGKSFTAIVNSRLSDFYVLGFNSDTGLFDRSDVAHG
jgi:hypothetical protein